MSTKYPHFIPQVQESDAALFFQQAQLITHDRFVLFLNALSI